jgi:hypothetical protein
MRRPITRMKLAAQVAKSVGKFIAVRLRKLPSQFHSDATPQRERLKGHHHHGGRLQCRWGDVSLENVFLTRIVRVSAGSWQPELYVEQPLVASEETASSSSSPNLLT